MISADGRLIRFLTTAPRRRWRSNHSTAERLIFESFQDHRRHIELLPMLLDSRQSRYVSFPPAFIITSDCRKAAGQRRTRDRSRLCRTLPKSERERALALLQFR